MKNLTLAAALVAATLALPASSHAQHPVAGPRWQGWLGCWSAAPAARMHEAGPEAPRIVCVTPTSEPDAVDVSAISEGKVVSQNHIDATGATHDVNAPGCTGTESARWSGDGRRVFLQSRVTCDGLATDMNAILAITRAGEWIDVRRVAAGGGSNVRVARYHDVGVPTVVPGEIALILPTLGRPDADQQRSGAQFVTIEDSFGTVHRSQGHLTPPVDLQSEVAIICGIATALVPMCGVPWND